MSVECDASWDKERALKWKFHYIVEALSHQFNELMLIKVAIVEDYKRENLAAMALSVGELKEVRPQLQIIMGDGLFR